MTPAERLAEFMRERHNVYLKKRAGAPKPWTTDPVLQRYRFCNVYRELDTATVWIREHIREPYAGHPNLWFMLAIARQINWPATLQELMDGGAWPTGNKWDWERARKIMLARQARGDQLYTGAYMLNAHGIGPDDPSDKAFFTCKLVLDSVWRARAAVQAAFGAMPGAWAAFLPFHGWGPFTAYEVVCDMRYTRYGEPWVAQGDVMRFANAGPGAVRGLNRLHGRPTRAPLKPDAAMAEMRELLPAVQKLMPRGKDWPRLELREIEHSLCEIDKKTRVETGEGRPRSKYHGLPTGE